MRSETDQGGRFFVVQVVEDFLGYFRIDRTVRLLGLLVGVLLLVLVVLMVVAFVLKRGPDTTSSVDREIATLQRQLQRNPTSSDVRLDLGWKLYQKGDYPAALAQYQEVLKSNSEPAGRAA
ncbi:MAG: tetratricopeptide repeat protein, partial [Chloroflexi bacterium]|nr:tetratricopeptide repeat protein [Chloroflexota bacterium]